MTPVTVIAVAFLGPIAILATAAMVLNRNVVTAMPSTPIMSAELPIADVAPKLVSVAPGTMLVILPRAWE